ncbi:MAG: H-NS histone family protein, partial [Candidatus Competibacteraceae bacterium]|nr:H-NS histone family protein [Candidatus Competibacteraceae bacterium]
LHYSGRRKGRPKYRNPADPDQTWTGRGKMPNWLKDAPNPEAYRIPE